MLISFSHRFIFVHVYKVAGRSIRNALLPYEWVPPPRYQWWRNATKKIGLELSFLRDRTNLLPCHASAKEIQEAYSTEVFRKFFKFAFVRNPWDWHVSLYHYTMQTGNFRQLEKLHENTTFTEYLEWITTEAVVLQQSFLCDDEGNFLVDYVGRLENIHQDFEAIASRLGLETQLPHENKTKRKSDYRRYYTDRTAAMVERAYQKDVELFGYSFEQETPGAEGDFPQETICLDSLDGARAKAA